MLVPYNSKLWQHFIRGDRKALALIFRTYYDDLFCYGLKITKSKDLTEDALQDLFLKLWLNKEKLPEVHNIKAYLLTSLRNIIFDNLKWQKKQRISENFQEDNPEIEFSVEDILIRGQINKDLRNSLIKALNMLAKRQKEAIYLKYFMNLDFESVAIIMELNIQSVRNLIHKGLSSLRKIKIVSG